MQVAILHPALPENASPEDQDTLVQVQTISATLERLGHHPVPLPCTLDLSALRNSLFWLRPELVFNLSESLEGADALQYLPSAVLDVLGVPYTGNSTEAIFQTSHKLVAKQILQLAGLPTPAWRTAESATGRGIASCIAGGAPVPPPEPPCIVKAVWEHASRGMDDHSVIRAGGAAAVTERLREHAAKSGRPCFAEQFVEGREFNVPVLDGPAGPEILPVGEIDFSAFPPEKPRIVGHRAKWHEDSFEYHHTPRHFHFAPEDGPLLDRLRELTLACWRLFGLRGYARVDFRVDAQGQPWILEINANPCLSPDAGFAAAIAEAGLAFEEAVGRILDRAVDGGTVRHGAPARDDTADRTPV